MRSRSATSREGRAAVGVGASLRSTTDIDAGDYERAYAVASAALEDHPDDASTHYDLACIKALAGEREKALEHWRRAVELNPKAREWAENDAELDAIRDAL